MAFGIGYITIFLAAIASGSVIPFPSEPVLAGLLLSQHYSIIGLVAAASVGNIIGSCINWYLGLNLEKLKDKKWFPAKKGELGKAQKWYGEYGAWSLLLSWVPGFGDPLTVMAGIMRLPLLRFLILVSIAKTARYAIFTALLLGATA